MRQQYIAIVLAATTTLSGCSGGTIFKQSRFGNIDVLSVDARQRLVLQGIAPDGKRIVCTEPSPDAIVAQAAALAAGASAPIGTANANAKLAAGFSESAASIGLRTETIQLLRDGYFRICEARLNGQIDETDYSVILSFIDEFIVTVAALEALGGKVVTPLVSVSAGVKSSVADQNVSTEGTVPPAALSDIKVVTTGVDKANAEQINILLHNYYNRKTAYLRWWASLKHNKR